MAIPQQLDRPLRARGQKVLALAICFFGLCVMGAGYLVARSLPRSPPIVPTMQATVVGYDTVELPVPFEDVAAGTPFREIKYQLQRFPRHQLPTEAVERPDELYGLVTTGSLPRGVPLLRSSFARPDGETNAVIERIPHGMRAMTLPVDETSAVEGWATSGVYVDVLLVRKDGTSVIAERVKILSAERSVNPAVTDRQDTSSLVPRTVTILVSQEQCLAISTALGHGKIAFALRSARDQEQWRDRQFAADRLNDGPASQNDQRKSVSGVVEIGGATYALVEGAWIKANHVPEGFFVGKQ